MTVPDVRVDRSNPIPLYYQVAQQLESAIESGELAVGERLENEIALADRYGLSRPTMRSAIGHLVDKGLLVRQRGVGTQVIRRSVERPVRLTSLFEDLVSAEQLPSTRVLLLERLPADDGVANQLGISVGTEVVHLERLRFAREEPLAVLRNWLPVAVAGDFSSTDLEEHGLYTLLGRTGTRIEEAKQRIGATAAEAKEARLLGVRKGAPLLTMERLSYNAKGRAVELGNHAYDSSRYSFTITLQSP
ncbi:MAG: transcriptional regulator, GntR family [Frankiales bacterium]|jgi:DNA-binding GntR family transcriptional regulator|nr:transcriptional regulator, GntR family [Frankiales bacterium]